MPRKSQLRHFDALSEGLRPFNTSPRLGPCTTAGMQALFGLTLIFLGMQRQCHGLPRRPGRRRVAQEGSLCFRHAKKPSKETHFCVLKMTGDPSSTE